MSKGDYFGEQALLYNKARTATVIAVTDVKIVSIGRDKLMDVLGSSLDHILYKNSLLIAIDKSPVLNALNSKQVESLLMNSKLIKYNAGELIISRSTPKNSKLYILLKGSIRGPTSDIEVHSCIGDKYIAEKNNECYNIDYIANEESDIVEITTEDLEMCIGGDITKVTINNETATLLTKVRLLRSISQTKIPILTDALRINIYSDKEVIIEQGSFDHNFYIIKSGSVKVYKNNIYIRDITKHDYFGERAGILNVNRSASVIASGIVECWVLGKEDFLGIINKEITDSIMNRIEFQESDAQLNDFIPIKVLGIGKFGNVVLVSEKNKKKLFAIKSVAKTLVQAYNIYENLSFEKNILMQLDHPFINRLYRTYKDEKRIYFLMEYIKGKDLFYILKELDVVSEEISKFYTACFLLAIEYLHERNIIHRDLKPENIIIDDEGYPKIIDFGTGRIVIGRTYTTVGTPHYIAPEIILKQGYTTSVDL